ncbi:MAG TPA: PilZ domain-containing protein [Candidatus Hydrogenedentes bacterium]|nr:PilZ domain-containing protein [Candidatus Hydrogenedentota bacterium]HPG67493.1 PilZ domain-containing protein [Candidatus Hydrogenedentota bacterium]
MDGQGSKDLENYLAVGQVMVFHPEPDQPSAHRLRTILRGWDKGFYLALDRPKLDNRFLALREQQRCIIRFLYEGMACGFDTYVQDWETEKGRPQFRVAWPDHFKMASIRKHERVQLSLPATIDMGQSEHIPAELIDLSLGGCGILVNRPVKVGSAMRISLDLPDGTSIHQMKAVARSVRTDTKGTFVGCSFEPGQEVLLSDIRFYVFALLGRMRGEDSLPQSVLVMEPEPGERQGIGAMLEEGGYQVIQSSGIVDGFFRLRLAQPMAFVLDCDQGELPWTEICRVVKNTRGFEKLPIFLYAGGRTSIREQALKAGVTAYFDTRESLVSSLGRYLSL